MGISADGRTIVGNGTNPSGQTEAWIAHIPDPATFLLLAVAAPAVLRRSMRQGSRGQEKVGISVRPNLNRDR